MEPAVDQSIQDEGAPSAELVEEELLIEEISRRASSFPQPPVPLRPAPQRRVQRTPPLRLRLTRDMGRLVVRVLKRRGAGLPQPTAIVPAPNAAQQASPETAKPGEQDPAVDGTACVHSPKRNVPVLAAQIGRHNRA
jgi:hypothetical protein